PVFTTLPATPHPGEVGLVPGVPGGVLARQEVQVVPVVARRHGHGVVAAPHQDRVAVGYDHDVVKPPVVVVQALEREAVRRRDPEVVDLVEVYLDTRLVLVVPVRGVARPVAGRRVHLYAQQVLGVARVQHVRDLPL